ncbi:MAG: HPr family phosphocarrier protein [Anaerolineaceae bacterium]|nr:HPr family phosphocarrier protein [Anaerolineaceae bacterium]
MASLEIIVKHSAGLHARPASKFVQTATKFPCTITVTNVTSASKTVNAKSILQVLTLGVNQDNTVLIEAEGEKETEALAALKELIESNFGE